MKRRTFISLGATLLANNVLARGQSPAGPQAPATTAASRGAANIANFTVNTAGWYTFLMAAKPGDAPNGFKFGNLDTQVDVRRRHADGSIFQAQVTCKPTRNGSHVVADGAAATGTFTPTIPTASVTAVISAGEVTGSYVATMPASVNLKDMWIDGPLCREWRHIVVPDKAGAPHPTVRVIFDCRVYNDGKAKVDVWFLNIKDSGTGKKLTADFTVTINGKSRLASGVGNGKTVLLYGWWQREFYTDAAGTWSEADVAPDWKPYQDSRLLAKYDLTKPPAYKFPSDYSSVPFDDRMGLLDHWGDPSKRFELGYGITGTAISYLRYKTPAGKAHLKALARQIGRWYGGVSLTDGIEPVDCLDKYPNYYMSAVLNPNPTLGNGPRNCNMTECSHDEKTYHGWENAHKNSPFFTAYLATGDRFFYDAQRLYAVNGVLQTTPKPTPTHIRRQHLQGAVLDGIKWTTYADNGGADSKYYLKQGLVTVPPSEGNQVRGMGRALTELVHASVIATDSQGGTWSRSRFKEVVETNLDFLDMRSRFDIQSGFYGPNPLQIPLAWLVGLHPDNKYNQSLSWTGTYLLFAIQIGIDTGHAKGVYARDKILNSMLLPMRASTAEWKGGKRFTIGYQRPIYMYSYLHPTMPNKMITTMAEAWNVSVGGAGTDADYKEWPDSTQGGYGEEQRAVCALAKDLGHPDGESLLAWCDAYVGLGGGVIADQLKSEDRAGHNWYGTYATR